MFGINSEIDIGFVYMWIIIIISILLLAYILLDLIFNDDKYYEIIARL